MNRAKPILLALLVLLLAACNGGVNSDQQATAVALAVSLTQEAAPPPPAENSPEATSGEEDTAASTPEAAAPTAENEAAPVAEPVDALSEAQQAATADAAARATTAAVAQETAAAQQAATATALVPILDELNALGVDTSVGRLAWQHPPLTLEATEFEDYAYDNTFLITPAQDFALVADVTWNSRFAESGCGFVVRSDGEEENLNQYIIGMTRGAQGHVLFAEQVEGDVDLSQVTDIYAGGIDPQFEWQNDTTNRMAVIGRGQEFTIYSNGVRLGSINAQAGFEEGFVAFIAVNRSGGIRCTFDNAYLWKIN